MNAQPRRFVIVAVLLVAAASLVSMQMPPGPLPAGEPKKKPVVEIKGSSGGRFVTPHFKLVLPQDKKVKLDSAWVKKALTEKVNDLKKTNDKGPPELFTDAARLPSAGFGSLRKTTDFPAPGPALGLESPRVGALAEQPIIERRATRRLEQVLFQSDFLPAHFLEVGAITQRTVGRIAFKFGALPAAGIGTGFLVSPTLLLTNNHVLPTADFAQQVELQMNYQMDFDGQLGPVRRFELDPADTFLTSPEVELDYTLIRVKPRTVIPAGPGNLTTVKPGEEFGFNRLTKNFIYSPNRQLVNIVQHPDGRAREVAIQNNLLTQVHPNVIRYTADTEHGSSGAPVYNNSWIVVGLHHSAGEKDDKGNYVNNEGIRIDMIIDHIKKAASGSVLQELGI